jgi:hypothetical protein
MLPSRQMPERNRTTQACGVRRVLARDRVLRTRLRRPTHSPLPCYPTQTQAYRPSTDLPTMDGAPAPEEDFSSLSIEDRLAHKNWKARVSAYEQLVKIFQTTADESDPAFRPYTSDPGLLKKIATDANAVAQEKGVECLVAFVKFAGETAARTREVVIPALVDKCLGSTRAGTRNAAIELALQFVEVENNGTGVVVSNDIC